MQIEIRQENSLDHTAICSITEEAFRGKPYTGGDEHVIIERLRNKSALALSLVAESNNTIVGHIAFSPITSSDNSGRWFALGPVSVLPKHQGKGIGSKLILEGLKQIEIGAALGCVLTGNPEFYSRFSFELAPDNAPSDEERDYFMIKCFREVRPAGPMFFASAFYGDS